MASGGCARLTLSIAAPAPSVTTRAARPRSRPGQSGAQTIRCWRRPRNKMPRAVRRPQIWHRRGLSRRRQDEPYDRRVVWQALRCRRAAAGGILMVPFEDGPRNRPDFKADANGVARKAVSTSTGRARAGPSGGRGAQSCSTGTRCGVPLSRPPANAVAADVTARTCHEADRHRHLAAEDLASPPRLHTARR